MKMKLNLLLIGIIVPFFAISQGGKRPLVEYSPLYEDPNINYISAHVDFLCFNMRSYNGSFSVVPGIKGKKDKFSIEAQFEICYLDRLNQRLTSSDRGSKSIYEHSMSNEFSLIGGYAIFDKVQEEDVSVKLKTSNDTIYKAAFKANVGTKFTVDLGFQKGVTNYYFEESLLGRYEIGGTYVYNNEPANLVSSPGSGTSTDADHGGISSYYAYNFLVLGASKYKQLDFKGVFGRYGERVVKFNKRIFAHALINLGGSFENIAKTEPLYLGSLSGGSQSDDLYITREIEIDSHIKKMPIGFRFGSEFNEPDGHGFGVGADVTVFPGASGNILNNIALNMKFRYSFGVQIK